MRKLALALLFGLCIFSAACGDTDNLVDYLEQGFEQIAHDFGGIQLLREAQNHSESVVYWPQNGFLSEPNHLLDVYSTMLRGAKEPERYNLSSIITCNPGAKSDYFKFIPRYVGTVKLGENLNHTSPCFASNSVSLRQVSADSVILEHNVDSPADWSCSDTYFYATTQNYHITSLFFRRTHKITFEGLTDYQLKEIQRTGIQIFRVCDSLANIFPDIFKTLLLFAGGFSTNPDLPFIGSHPPFWMEAANIDFIKQATGYEWKKRANSTRINLDPKYIHSGDFIAITRFDGLDQLIEWGTGSHAGHSAVAFWIGDELHILESQAGWYWPQKNIQRTPYKQWLEWADNAGYQVTILPLKPEIRQKFNTTKAYEWFQRVEGVPYGFHNFLFGWIDTEDASYPPLLSAEIIAPVFSIMENYVPGVGDIFNEAINMRLGTKNLSIPELAEVIDQRNLTWAKVFAMPEQDSWKYSDGPDMVCSAFVVALWKAGGLFGDMEIQATEFTPRDAYSLTFIDPNPVLPQACKDNDPNAQFCQIMGKYKMEFPQLSTVDPYPHMNERCPSQPQNNYYRPPGC